MDLKDLLKKYEEGDIVDYDHSWNSPLDPRVRQGVMVGATAAAAAVPIGLWCTPTLAEFAHIGILGGWLGLGALSFPFLLLIGSPLIIAVNVLMLGLYALVWYKTQGLREGNLIWHRTGVGVSAMGAVNVISISVPLVIGIASIVLTILLIAVAIGIAVAVLGAAPR